MYVHLIRFINDSKFVIDMPKFDENSICHFFDVECQFPIPEDTLKELLEDAEKDEIITKIPAIDDLFVQIVF